MSLKLTLCKALSVDIVFFYFINIFFPISISFVHASSMSQELLDFEK